MFPALQFILFCLVGAATTAIDFAVFNLLTRPAAGWPRIPANIVSVSLAMAWSFLANWLIVFRPGGEEWIPRAGRFLATTAFSAFVLQNLILYVTTNLWRSPVRFALWLSRTVLNRSVNEDLIARNTCKLLAVSAGLIWNFCWYKFFVYSN